MSLDADLLDAPGHYETVPYDDRTIRSVYHIREYDVARLLQVRLRTRALAAETDLEPSAPRSRSVPGRLHVSRLAAWN